MYTPTNTPLFGSITPVTTIDLSLHTFLGVSWHILLPYTVFGIAIMVYSHGRLMRGQRELKRATVQKRA
jgi:hypothetical protein